MLKGLIVFTILVGITYYTMTDIVYLKYVLTKNWKSVLILILSVLITFGIFSTFM